MIEITFCDGRKSVIRQTGDYTAVPIKPNGENGILTIKTSVSLVDVHNIWVSSGIPGPEKTNMPWILEINSGIHKNFPFASVFNTSGSNRGTFCTTNLTDDTQISFKLNQEKAIYEISCRISICSETRDFEVILDMRDMQWQEILRQWRDKFDITQTTYPNAAKDPVFCTWYAVHGSVTQDFVEENCRTARELGLTTLIVDDGWSYDEKKRVTPVTLENWYNTIGDWNVSTAKFPDFKEHVKRVQAMGMKYMIWVTPTLWGVDSELIKKYPDMTFEHVHEGCKWMDANKADFTPIISKMRALAAENNLDGLKIDFLDIVQPDVDAPNARSNGKLMKGLSDALKSDNPQVLIEFRQSYVSMETIKYATQFRAGDVPYNWYCNFGRLVELRLAIGSHAPIHADPAFWPPEEKHENISRHMMAMLAGVPMISMDLTKLSDAEKKIISFYIGIYNRYRELINHGKWNFIFGISDIQAAFVENDKECMAIIADAGSFDKCLAMSKGKNLAVMNISSEALYTACKNAVNASCDSISGECIPAGGSALVIC